MAWEACRAAVAEAQYLYASGTTGAEIQDLLQHARELLDIIDDEIALSGVALPEWARGGLGELRARVATLESTLITKH